MSHGPFYSNIYTCNIYPSFQNMQHNLLIFLCFSTSSIPYIFSSFMASYENNDMNLVEMDLEVFEIDQDLLRELLEEDQEGKDDKDHHGNVEYCMAETVEENSAHPDMMDRAREQEQQQQNCLEKYEFHSMHDFEWLEMMEPTNPLNDVRMNWFSDDNVGMVDFGYANEECYSQNYCDWLVSNEASYVCLWEEYDI